MRDGKLLHTKRAVGLVVPPHSLQEATRFASDEGHITPTQLTADLRLNKTANASKHVCSEEQLEWTRQHTSQVGRKVTWADVGNDNEEDPLPECWESLCMHAGVNSDNNSDQPNDATSVDRHSLAPGFGDVFDNAKVPPVFGAASPNCSAGVQTCCLQNNGCQTVPEHRCVAVQTCCLKDVGMQTSPCGLQACDTTQTVLHEGLSPSRPVPLCLCDLVPPSGTVSCAAAGVGAAVAEVVKCFAERADEAVCRRADVDDVVVLGISEQVPGSSTPPAAPAELGSSTPPAALDASLFPVLGSSTPPAAQPELGSSTAPAAQRKLGKDTSTKNYDMVLQRAMGCFELDIQELWLEFNALWTVVASFGLQQRRAPPDSPLLGQEFAKFKDDNNHDLQLLRNKVVQLETATRDGLEATMKLSQTFPKLVSDTAVTVLDQVVPMVTTTCSALAEKFFVAPKAALVPSAADELTAVAEPSLAKIVVEDVVEPPAAALSDAALPPVDIAHHPCPVRNRAFVEGEAVMLTGLSMRPSLNGECGNIFGYDEKSDRFVVKILKEDGVTYEVKPLKIKKANLMSIDMLDDRLEEEDDSNFVERCMKHDLHEPVHAKSASRRDIYYDSG